MTDEQQKNADNLNGFDSTDTGIVRLQAYLTQKGAESISDDAIKARINICVECSNIDSKLTCNSVSLKYKVRNSLAQCPLNKWS